MGRSIGFATHAGQNYRALPKPIQSVVGLLLGDLAENPNPPDDERTASYIAPAGENSGLILVLTGHGSYLIGFIYRIFPDELWIEDLTRIYMDDPSVPRQRPRRRARFSRN